MRGEEKAFHSINTEHFFDMGSDNKAQKYTYF